MNNKILELAKALKEECDKTNCEECPLINSPCRTYGIPEEMPCYWVLPEAVIPC